jgi:hypothetical protein
MTIYSSDAIVTMLMDRYFCGVEAKKYRSFIDRCIRYRKSICILDYALKTAIKISEILNRLTT